QQVQELDVYVDINSKKHVNLNEFLQQRDVGKHLGKHVIDAVMGYVQELEEENKFGTEQMESLVKNHNRLDTENKRYREALVKINDWDWETHQEIVGIARKALEGEE